MEMMVGYYRQTCPEAEEIISETVAKAVKANPGGCDGSLLLDSSDDTAEKDPPVNNPSLRGYDIIDEAKCAGVVSCADVVAFSARDSAYQVCWWTILGCSRWTKRLKGISRIRGHMVTLSGAHSIGVSHCSSFTGDHLYNFSGRGGQDPSMDSKYALQLKAKCPSSASNDTVVQLDRLTPTKRVNINAKYPKIWRENFGRAMIKMGAIDVLTGSQGEIRKQCHVPN
ncbi:peroxidase 5-like [Cryptomeria japonica]|uniref:peroxidase 5-like n=1 Tax=Cryptomeria japonica TaxID=3369 RepID=UPI0027DA8075|nr:peroxidase 5-like [Cryptomeria japonica]